MINQYLDCFQLNLEYILLKYDMDYFNICIPRLDLRIEQGLITVDYPDWITSLRENGFYVKKIKSIQKKEFLNDLYIKNKFSDCCFILLKTNLNTLSWNISAGDHSDVAHWITINKNRIIDPYYQIETEIDSVANLIKDVVPNLGEKYVAYIIYKQQVGIQSSKKTKCKLKYDYISDLTLEKYLRRVIEKSENFNQLDKENIYDSFLHIANSRIQMYFYCKNNIVNDNLKSILFSLYQEWIAMANIYLRFIFKQYLFNDITVRVENKMKKIIELEHSLSEELQKDGI